MKRTVTYRSWSRTLLQLLLVLFLQILFVSVPFGEPGNKLTPKEKPTLVVGYSRKLFINVDINDARAATKAWAEMIIKKTAKFEKSDTVILDDVSSIEKLVTAKGVDLIVMRPEEFIVIGNKTSIVPIFVPDFGKYFYSQYVLLVRSDRGIVKLSELRHKKLIRESGQSGDIPSLWLDTFLMRQGLGEAKDFFTGNKGVSKAAQAILPVFFKQVDVALAERNSFDVMVELNPQLGKELKVLATSQNFLGAVLCLRKEFFEMYKEDIEDALDSLHKDPQGKQILMLFRANKLVPFKYEYLNSMDALLKENQELRTKLVSRR